MQPEAIAPPTQSYTSQPPATTTPPAVEPAAAPTPPAPITTTFGGQAVSAQTMPVSQFGSEPATTAPTAPPTVSQFGGEPAAQPTSTEAEWQNPHSG